MAKNREVEHADGGEPKKIWRGQHLVITTGHHVLKISEKSFNTKVYCELHNFFSKQVHCHLYASEVSKLDKILFVSVNLNTWKLKYFLTSSLYL